MEDRRSPTIRLFAGLVVTLSAVAVYSGFTFVQLRGLEDLQTTSIDRDRLDSLLLLRIQGNLNQIALTMRDMLDGSEPYPLSAWRGQFNRIRTDLADALEQEAKYSPVDQPGSSVEADQRKQMASNVAQFWDALDRVFALADAGDPAKARDFIRLSLQARQDTLSAAVSRLLRANNEAEQEASARVTGIYAGVRRNAYSFLAAMAVAIVLTSLYLVHYIRGLFERVAALSERRSELAQQLTSMQENTFRSISASCTTSSGRSSRPSGLCYSGRPAAISPKTSAGARSCVRFNPPSRRRWRRFAHSRRRFIRWPWTKSASKAPWTPTCLASRSRPALPSAAKRTA